MKAVALFSDSLSPSSVDKVDARIVSGLHREGVSTAEIDRRLLHDDTLDRTTNCSGAANAHTLAEVKACDAAYWFAPGQGVTAPSTDVDHPLRATGVTVPTLPTGSP